MDGGGFGASPDAEFGSRDLSELALGKGDAAGPPPALAHLSEVFTENPGPVTSIRTADAKLIFRSGEKVEREIYDLLADPNESVNLVGERDPREAALGAVLEAWGAKEPMAEGGGAVQLGAEKMEQLKDLGYIQ